MAKKFAEYNGLDLTRVNNEMFEAWNNDKVFAKSIEEREGCPQFVFLKALLQLTDIPVFIMCLPVR